MKRTAKIMTLIFALALSAGMLAGCSDSTDAVTDTTALGTSDDSSAVSSADTNDAAESDTSSDGDMDMDSSTAADRDAAMASSDTVDDASAVDEVSAADSAEQDMIGEVSYVGGSFLTLDLYSNTTEVDSYLTLDIGTLEASGTTTSVSVRDGAEFCYTDSGEEYSTTQDSVVEGSVVVVTTSDSGAQKFVILNYGGTDDANGDVTVAMVDGVADDGTLSLIVYKLTDAAADYSISDYADVDFESYEATDETLEYVPDSAMTIQTALDGVLTDTDSTEIAEGDMLVIHADDSGSDAVVIFHPDAETDA